MHVRSRLMDNDKYLKESFNIAYEGIKGKLRFHGGNREIERLTDRTKLIELHFIDDDDDWPTYHLGIREAFADWAVAQWNKNVDDYKTIEDQGEIHKRYNI